MQVHVGSSPVIRTMSLLQMQKAHFLCTPLFFYKNRADHMICSVYFNISNATQQYKTRNRPLFYACDCLLPPNFACTGVDHIISQSLYKCLWIVHIEYEYFFLINLCCDPYIALSGTAHIKPTIVF